MATIELKGITKQYKSKRRTFTIRGLNLTVPDGKTVVILGPSGCGKTTILRLIAGLEKPDAGTILFNGQGVGSIPPGERRIGMVFQNLALYPHFTAKENILSHFFFTRKRKEYKELAEDRLAETSRLLDVEIEYLLDRKPRALSGGEKQRVALGRCITRDPQLFLLDEPFSNLDAPLRGKYRLHLKKLLQKFNITSVYVTHDQYEAFVLGDIIAVMRDGTIEQTGTFHQLYDDPTNLFIADFLNTDPQTPSLNLVKGTFFGKEYENAIFGLRPEEIEVSTKEKSGFHQAIVTFIIPQAERNRITLEVQMGDTALYAPAAADRQITAGQTVWLKFVKYFQFDKTTGARLV
jgi:ABC-type sugar transport system ATPase subunit